MPRAEFVLALCIPIAAVAGLLAGILIDTYHLRPDPQPVVLRQSEPRPLMWQECQLSVTEYARLCYGRKQSEKTRGL